MKTSRAFLMLVILVAVSACSQQAQPEEMKTAALTAGEQGLEESPAVAQATAEDGSPAVASAVKACTCK